MDETKTFEFIDLFLKLGSLTKEELQTFLDLLRNHCQNAFQALVAIEDERNQTRELQWLNNDTLESIDGVWGMRSLSSILLKVQPNTIIQCWCTNDWSTVPEMYFGDLVVKYLEKKSMHLKWPREQWLEYYNKKMLQKQSEDKTKG